MQGIIVTVPRGKISSILWVVDVCHLSSCSPGIDDFDTCDQGVMYFTIKG